MDIVKISKNLYRIYHLNNGKREFLKIVIPQIASPFGLELFQGVQYLNLEIDNKKSNHSNLWGDLIKIDEYFIDYIDTYGEKSINWLSSLRKKDKFNPLWKVRILKDKHVDTYINDQLCTWNELLEYTDNFKKDTAMEITLQSLWIRNNQAGLVWIITKVNA